MTKLPFRLNLDRQSSSLDIPELLFLGRQVDDLPHVAREVLRPAVVPMEIVPPNATILSTFQRPSGCDLLVEAPDFLLLIETYAEETYLGVAARTHEKASEMMGLIKGTSADGVDPRIVKIAFWRSKSGDGGMRMKRTIDAQPWSEIAVNYPAASRTRIQRLMEQKGISDGEGRLLLFHGEPGTGKTTAVRSLMRAWEPWCEIHLVSDPERLFAQSEYLLDVLHSQEGRFAPTLNAAAPEPKWKLVVVEDADEFLKRTTHPGSGTSLGRLLNSTDGLLGRSSRTIMLLSTNEPVTRLHPALTRPGRCLAEIEFPRFSQRESSEWLGGVRVGTTGGATLAELYEARRTGAPVPGDSLPTGTYL